MTKNERDDCKKLVDEAISRKKNRMYRVRGPPGQMRIISIKKK